MGPNNSISNDEFDALAKETESLTISGLKTFVQSTKDKIEDEICSWNHFVMVKDPNGATPKFLPCLPNVEGALLKKDIHLENVLPPIIRYKDISQQPVNSAKAKDNFTSYRKRMKLSRHDYNKLSGVKDDEGEYSEEMYKNYVKRFKCKSRDTCE